jgi:phosphopantothenoylcysteine decarboxylase / phosphopantothenate---cysteine ligase
VTDQCAPVLRGRRILLGVSGSIAAFKAVALASQLTQLGALVDVCLTRAAAAFIQPLSFEAITHRGVYLDPFDAPEDSAIAHVTVGREAELSIVAPATAHTIARLSLGLADDFLTTALLASSAPLLIAPAMDAGMYEHPTVREHLDRLIGRGATVLEPSEGHLASGLQGRGRLAEPELIVEHARSLLGRTGDLSGWNLLVSAGGTQEPLDPVRYLGNRSSGKMGAAIAAMARDRGASVTLVVGPTAVSAPFGVTEVRVRTAQEMCDAVCRELPTSDALIMAAAVADFRPEAAVEQKIKKSGDGLVVRLVPNPDILKATIGVEGRRGRPVRVGFAAESQDLLTNAQAKLEAKDLDLVVANDITLAGSGFESDHNQAAFLGRGGVEQLPRLPKLELANRILDRVLDLLRRTKGTG